MAEDYKIDVNKREGNSKQAVKQLRREGNIPGVYYSADSKSSHSFFITQEVFQDAVKSRAHIFNISVGGKKRNVLFKSVQYHPVTDEVLHIDLYGVKMDEVVNVKVAINFIGDPKGVREEGGVLSQATNEIEIQCLPGDIPDAIDVDISEIGLGDSINASVIVMDGKITLLTSKDTVLASVTHAMREIEPVVVEVDEDEEVFLDEEGVPIEAGEATEGEKPAEEGGAKPQDKYPDSK